MKTVAVSDFNFDHLPEQGLVVTRDGQPLALVVDVKGLDIEQIEFGKSSEFWQLIAERRSQPTISRQELERRLDNDA